METDTKAKIAVIVLVAVAALIYVAYWYKSLQPVPKLTGQIKEDSTHKKDVLSEELANDSGPEGLTVRQEAMPPITIQEFTTPNFTSSLPKQAEVVPLNGLDEVRLLFSRKLGSGSTIDVLTGNRIVASGGDIKESGAALVLPMNAGIFSGRSFGTGMYEVYYQACFVDDTCYKGQYAFVGVQS